MVSFNGLVLIYKKYETAFIPYFLLKYKFDSQLKLR